jgi:hypothetical protein
MMEARFMARPEVTGKKIVGESANLEAFSINEFCARHGPISRSYYYKLKEAGLGPREIRIGARVLISKEAAAAWRRERETTTEAAA